MAGAHVCRDWPSCGRRCAEFGVVAGNDTEFPPAKRAIAGNSTFAMPAPAPPTEEGSGWLGRMNAASGPRVGRKCAEFGGIAGIHTECRPTRRGIAGYADVGITGVMPTSRLCRVGVQSSVGRGLKSA